MKREKFGMVGAMLVLGASIVSGATIAKKDGSTVEGDVMGTIILADAGRPMFAVVEGKDIESIDNRGIRLKVGAVVVHAGMPLGTDREIYKTTGIPGY